MRHIESNTGKSARQGNLRHPRVRFQSIADEARRVSERLKSYWHLFIFVMLLGQILCWICPSQLGDITFKGNVSDCRETIYHSFIPLGTCKHRESVAQDKNFTKIMIPILKLHTAWLP